MKGHILHQPQPGSAASSGGMVGYISPDDLLKTIKRNTGERDIPVRFAGVTFQSGHYLYADEDGVLVSEKPLI